ncbi:MAG: LytR C-terminal domain-containing protein [Candidatus Liptonbacteria bacterium]
MKFNLDAEQLKKIEFKKLVYPLATFFFILIIVAIFMNSAVFLSDSINRSFVLEESLLESRIVRLDMDSLEEVAQKLGITIAPAPREEGEEEGGSEVPTSPAPAGESVPATGATSTAEELVASSTPTSTPPVDTIEPTEPDKSAIKIAVYNSSGVPGRAAALRDHLLAAGFKVDAIGNVTLAEELTVLKIKESKKEYAGLLSSALSEKYELGSNLVLEEESQFDAIVIVGRGGLR